LPAVDEIQAPAVVLKVLVLKYNTYLDDFDTRYEMPLEESCFDIVFDELLLH